MANFIVLNRNTLATAAVLSRSLETAEREGSDNKILGKVEEALGSMPFYGSISAVLQNFPAIKNYSNRIYENFSRRKLNTLFIEGHDLLIIKMGDKIAAPRKQDTDSFDLVGTVNGKRKTKAAKK